MSQLMGLLFLNKMNLTLLHNGFSMISDGKIYDLTILDELDASFINNPYELLFDTSDNPITFIVLTIYPNIEEPHLNLNYFLKRIVTPKNITFY